MPTATAEQLRGLGYLPAETPLLCGNAHLFTRDAHGATWFHPCPSCQSEDESARHPNVLNYEPPPGIYQHHKGGKYEVIAVATSDTDERVVVYRAATETGEWYVRPVRRWNAPTTEGEARFVPLTHVEWSR